jgi:hypothetical protein
MPGDLNKKLGKEDIFRTTIGNYRIQTKAMSII